jgi:hypothetical protein
MSDLAFLVAESFLLVAGAVSMIFISKLAVEPWAAILTGVLQGIPVSPRIREAMLFGIWLPYQSTAIAVAAFLALTQLTMINHVTDANVKMVVYFGAFLAAVSVAFNLLNAAYGLFGLRAKVRGEKMRQAEGD